MKIRQSFVTNSSSTSYTVVIEKDYFDEIIKDFSPFVKAVCKALADSEPQKLFGKDIIVLTWGSGNRDTLEYLDVPVEPSAEEEEEGDEAYGSAKHLAVNKLEEALKDKSRFLMTAADC